MLPSLFLSFSFSVSVRRCLGPGLDPFPRLHGLCIRKKRLRTGWAKKKLGGGSSFGGTPSLDPRWTGSRVRDISRRFSPLSRRRRERQGYLTAFASRGKSSSLLWGVVISTSACSRRAGPLAGRASAGWVRSSYRPGAPRLGRESAGFLPFFLGCGGYASGGLRFALRAARSEVSVIDGSFAPYRPSRFARFRVRHPRFLFFLSGFFFLSPLFSAAPHGVPVGGRFLLRAGGAPRRELPGALGSSESE